MADYDSDSSDDGADYTTTNVILGYASNESGGDEISHIGGHPIWLDDKHTPPLSFSKCQVCNGYLSLLLQLNADLQQHFPHDTRRIFVLSCRNKACSRKPKSIRAFREVKKGQTRKKVIPSMGKDGSTTTQESNVQTQSEGLGSLLFGGSASSQTTGGNANPFSKPLTQSTSSVNPFSSPSSTTSTTTQPQSQSSADSQRLPETFAAKLKLNAPGVSPTQKSAGPTEPWPAESAFPTPFPHSYLDAYPEELDPTPAAPRSEASTSNAQYDTEDGAGTGGGEKDTFESSLDKTFQRFSDLVAQNPEQVLRYEFNGQPLLYSGSDTVSSRFVVSHGKAGAVQGMPRCDECGSHRVFELQLMPYLIFEIEKDDAMDINDGMEWGTVIVGSCANNCGDEGTISFREEWVGAQWEERITRK